jgi:hypothetical protein
MKKTARRKTQDLKHKTQNFKRGLNLISLTGLLLIPLLFVVCSPPKADAQFVRSFTTIPPRLEIAVEPGEFVEQSVKFRNESDSAVSMIAIPQNFIVMDSKGTPVFVSEAVSGRWAAASWMSLAPDRFSLGPQQSIVIQLKANVPEDALPGGHYAGILFQPAEVTLPGGMMAGTEAGMGIVQTVGTLVYFNVAGPITERAIVKLFDVPFFQEFGPVTFNTEILNNSDIHIQPQGEIKVTNMLGRLSITLPLEERNVFPNAIFAYTNTWEAKYLLGRYRADLMATYGSTGQVLQATAYFWVFPVKIALVVLLAITIIILIIVLILKKKREKKLEEEIEDLEEEVEEAKEKSK